MTERMTHHFVRHHPGVPRESKAKEPGVAPRCFVHRRHLSSLIRRSLVTPLAQMAPSRSWLSGSLGRSPDFRRVRRALRISNQRTVPGRAAAYNCGDMSRAFAPAPSRQCGQRRSVILTIRSATAAIGRVKPRSRRIAALVASAVVSFGVLGFSNPAGSVPVPWKNCGTAGDPVAVQRFDASVWPPQAGRPLTLIVAWTLERDIDEGDFGVLTVGTSPLDFQSQLPLSLFAEWTLAEEMVRGINGPRNIALPSFFPFPVFLTLQSEHSGPHSETSTFTVPAWLAGKVFALHFAAYDLANDELVCQNVTVPIK